MSEIIKDKFFNIISNTTGHHIDDIFVDMCLSRDLGIDSIKQISVAEKIIKLVPEENQADYQISLSKTLVKTPTLGELLSQLKNFTAQQSGNGGENFDKALSLILDQVQSVTGHAVTDLLPSMRLNQDLGIDSIKSITLLGSIAQQLPDQSKKKFEQIIIKNGLSGAETIAELADILSDIICDNVIDHDNNSEQKKSENNLLNTGGELTILYAQYQHLISQFAMDSSTLCSRIKITGKLNKERLKQAWQQLVEKHPALRMTLENSHTADSLADLRMIAVENPQVPEISFDDLQEKTGCTETALLSEMNKRLMQSWDVYQWPLHDFTLYQTSVRTHHLFLSIHHLIADGLSNQLILRELFTFYKALESNTCPELPATISIDEYHDKIIQMNSADDKSNKQELEIFLKSQKTGRFKWHPAGRETNTSKLKMSSLPLTINKKQSTLLCRLAAQLNISLNSLLVTLLLKSVNRLTNDENIFINIPTSGRLYDDIDMLESVGDFAQNIVLEFNAINLNNKEDKDFTSSAYAVHETIQDALGKGYDHAIIKQLANAARGIALSEGEMSNVHKQLLIESIKSNLYLSFVGNSGIQKKYGNLSLANYHPATVTVRGGIDNLIEQFDDQIIWSINFDQSCINIDEITRLKDAIVTSINESLKVLSSTDIALVKEKAHSNNSYEKSIIENIQGALKETLNKQVDLSEFDKDMQQELGMDSLRRINFVNKLRRRIKGVNASELLKCSKLSDIATRLSNHSNVTPMPTLTTSSMHAAVTKQCIATPNAIAISEQGQQLTYQELHLKSNHLAHHLRAQNIKPNDLVGILLDRSIDMIISVLAILKSGAAYLPIDPSYPLERMCYILNHSGSQMLLTSKAHANKLAKIKAETTLSIAIEIDGESSWMNENHTDLHNINQPDDLMTVLYTSGSTGKPKGVMLSHAGYINRIEWMSHALGVNQQDRIAFKTSCGFDISVWEIFLPLMTGATLYPVDQQTVANPWDFSDWINQNKITIMHFVPSLFGEFLTVSEDEAFHFPSLRWLIFSGESLPIGFVRRWFDRYGNTVKLANLYGPTEASIDVTAHFIPQKPADTEHSIPIGKPITNTHILILDQDLIPCKKGEVGELYIAGIQLAKGYLNDAEKTTAAFIDNPFPEIPGSKLYRSGDLASWLMDGNVDYHGRIDSQVKIRGFRIELGEVEAVLQSYTETAEAVVLVNQQEDNYRYLQALIHPNNNTLDIDALRQHVAAKLPEYMIPAKFVILDKVPRTHNGKIDRKALASQYAPSRISDDRDAKNISSTTLAPAQRWLVSHFEHPYQWAGVFSFQYLDQLDHRVLCEAVNTITARHSALRTYFQEQESGLQQLIITDAQQNEPVRYLDGSHLSDQQRQHKLDELIASMEQRLNIFKWPLWEFACIKVSDHEHTIVIVAHHMIGDMLSSAILFKDLWKAYSQLLTTDTVNLGAEQGSVHELIKHLENAEKKGDLDSHIEYWKKRFPSPHARFQIPLDHVRGANSESTACSVKVTLDQSLTTELRSSAQGYYGGHLYPLLLAPLYRSLSEWSDAQWVTVSHRSHGRAPGGATHYLESIGNFAINYPLSIEIPNQGDFHGLVNLIKHELNDVPMAGISYDYLAESLPSHCYPDHNLTSVRANFLGDRSLPNSPLFKFNEENFDRRLCDSDSERTTLIEVFFSIVDGCLMLEISYSSHFHHQKTIENLARRWHDNILELLKESRKSTLTESVRD